MDEIWGEVPGWAGLVLSIAAGWIGWLAHRRAGRAEAREREALDIARRAQEIAERAEARATEAHNRSRVSFEYEDSQVRKGLYAGDVKIRLRHTEAVMVDSVQFDNDRLKGWAVSVSGFNIQIQPGGRAEVQMARNRFGELPESLLLHWWIGEETGSQEVPLPAELTQAPKPTP
ncbi:hypothetical protein [Microbacterium dauci]|uniref:Uncharacterized protein n=1 Tax=Microbacterium dauci TaxID=3048008 RepID=A0ABT6ZC42_9MICO|nr:hypothetical protein [Microbacterium sp. LX3-4]MDJ1113207.1 hypothetical protein [Microbacterium sp. LX3-4]